jgi:hypothetical protein
MDGCESSIHKEDAGKNRSCNSEEMSHHREMHEEYERDELESMGSLERQI